MIRFLLYIAVIGLIAWPTCHVSGLDFRNDRMESYGPNGIFQLESIEENNSVAFYIDNRQFADITVSLYIESTNLISSKPLPYTASYPGNMRSLALELRPKNDKLMWHYASSYHWRWGNMRAIHDSTIVYSLPYAAGDTYTVIQGFNGQFSHTGEMRYAIDWAMPEGTPVLAARSGRIIAVEESFSTGGPDEAYRDSGNYVLVLHDDGTIGQYYHFRCHGIDVTPGEEVTAGELLGYSGNTGYSTVPHLHFAVTKPLDGRHIESIAIRFRTGAGDAEYLEQGKSYTAP